MVQGTEDAVLPEGPLAYPNSLPRPEGELEKLKAAWALPRGWRILSAVNNTIIGYFYIGTAFLFFLLAGVLALLMRHFEPRRVCRRPFRLSHAAMAGCSSMA